MSTTLLNKLDGTFTPIVVNSNFNEVDFTDKDDTFDASTNDATVPWHLFGNGGNDTLTGGNKDDLIDGGTGVNHENGGKGNDTFIGADGSGVIDYMDGGAGDHDKVDFSNAGSSVTLNLVPDSSGYGLATTAGSFLGGSFLKGIEDATGSVHNDTMTGDGNANTFYGNDGNDTLSGAGGDDKLYGQGGDDVLLPGFGADVVDGGSGTNTVSYTDDVNVIGTGVTLSLADGVGTGGWANGDTYEDIQNVDGSKYGDVIKGDANANVLDGREGDDVLQGLGGADTFIGGDGEDKVTFGDARHGVTVDLAAGTGTGGDGATLTFEEVEDLDGSTHNDVLKGDKGANVINGGDGDDTITGGLGNDTLTGGIGHDNFVYNKVADSDTNGTKSDVITDFTAADDTIDLSAIAKAVGVSEFTYEANPNPNASHYAGEVTSRFDSSQNATYVEVYTDNDQSSDMIIELTGNVTLHQSNFIS